MEDFPQLPDQEYVIMDENKQRKELDDWEMTHMMNVSIYTTKQQPVVSATILKHNKFIGNIPFRNIFLCLYMGRLLVVDIKQHIVPSEITPDEEGRRLISTADVKLTKWYGASHIDFGNYFPAKDCYRWFIDAPRWFNDNLKECHPRSKLKYRLSTKREDYFCTIVEVTESLDAKYILEFATKNLAKVQMW